jgi:DNA repair protein RadA/Sms
VLERKAGIKVAKDDCYVATVGGLKIVEPAADLAIALSIASAAKEKPIDPTVVAIGEIGLTGEIRRATNVNRRLSEAERLGMSHAIVPAGTTYSGKLKVHQVDDLADAINVLNQLSK